MFCEGSDSKHGQLCGLWALPQLLSSSVIAQKLPNCNRWEWLYSNKTLSKQAAGQIWPSGHRLLTPVGGNAGAVRWKEAGFTSDGKEPNFPGQGPYTIDIKEHNLSFHRAYMCNPAISLHSIFWAKKERHYFHLSSPNLIWYKTENEGSKMLHPQ